MIGSNDGGTGGGLKMGRKKLQIRTPWKCPTCEADVPYFWKNCPSDGTRRPT